MDPSVTNQPEPIIIEDKEKEVMESDQLEGDKEADLKKERRRTSKVWLEFTVVTMKDGKEKAKCNYCTKLISINSQGSTTQFHRHLENCPVRRASNKKQRLLATQPLGPSDFGGGSGGTITTYRYDKEKVRECLAKMVIVHEYSFRMLEHEFFVMLCKTLNPRFEKMSRITLRNDCMKLYALEKKNLKTIFESVERFSLTSDLWTSNQNIGYMCLTCHFLDSEWKLQKRILNFCALAPPHTGLAISDCISECLIDWGIENKISSITLDNASTNDVAVRNLKSNFALKEKLFFKGKVFHVRCCAHVLNLMVQDGISEIKDVIANVRESVKYFKMSPSRLHKFTEIVKQLQLPTSKGLVLDVSTRWNSTYAMLESALRFKDVFPRYQERDPHYQWLPSSKDWDQVLEVCKFLEAFNDATLIFSGVNYPTSNLFRPEVWKIRQILNEKSGDGNVDFVKKLALKMREKFDKYWGDCSLLMAMGAVLDPRYKMKLVEFCYSKIYPATKANEEIELVRFNLHELYAEYISNRAAGEAISNNNAQEMRSLEVGGRKIRGKTKGRTEFALWTQELDSVVPSKSELDIYLEEGLYICNEELDGDFNVLDWWKMNTLKFRTLSKMARDILSIPITTVASESAFSAGGRVLDQYRSSLKPETVQAIVCTGDWLRAEWKVTKAREFDDEENMQKVDLSDAV
ncbi:hypothetical protein OROHE_007943 [Orobanche hederae]